MKALKIFKRKCCHCGIKKAINLFPRNGSGYGYVCRNCDNMVNQLKYLMDKDTDQYRRRKRRSSKIWHLNNPQKVKVYAKVKSALNSGIIKKPSKCQSCNTESKIHSHHSDYRKPLEVKWLCVICHEGHHHAR